METTSACYIEWRVCIFDPSVASHRATELEWHLCGSSSLTPVQSRVSYNRLTRTLSSWGMSISKDGDMILSSGCTLRLTNGSTAGPVP